LCFQCHTEEEENQDFDVEAEKLLAESLKKKMEELTLRSELASENMPPPPPLSQEKGK
jgi:hypothetical protein